MRDLFATLTARAETASSFLDASAWFEPGSRVIYRTYATLSFCVVIDGSESELGILDLIQVLVETLDRHFKNVCELDVIFSSPQARTRPAAKQHWTCTILVAVLTLLLCSPLRVAQCHWVVDEMIVGGLVVETNPSEILEAIEAQARIERQQSDVGQAAAAAQQSIDRLAGSVRSYARPP